MGLASDWGTALQSHHGRKKLLVRLHLYHLTPGHSAEDKTESVRDPVAGTASLDKDVRSQPRLAWSLRSSCLGPLSSWDRRTVPPGPQSFFKASIKRTLYDVGLFFTLGMSGTKSEPQADRGRDSGDTATLLHQS